MVFDPVRDDPIVQHLLARAGLDQLPQGPGVGLPYGPPDRTAWEPRPSDVERAASPEWRDEATRFADAYPARRLADLTWPGLTLADRTLAALADFETADRARLCFATGDAVQAQELRPVLTAVRAAIREFWRTPTGQEALALGEGHAAALDRQAAFEALAERYAAAQDHPAALEALAERDAAARDAQVYTRSWNRRRAVELALIDALAARLLGLGPDADAADRRTGVPNRQLGSPGQVAADVADYLAAHHRDGKRVWADVVLVLEFYGWDLGKTAVRYKARALKVAAWRARERPEAEASAVPQRQV